MDAAPTAMYRTIDFSPKHPQEASFRPQPDTYFTFFTKDWVKPLENSDSQTNLEKRMSDLSGLNTTALTWLDAGSSSWRAKVRGNGVSGANAM
jgi:hypothetical protein